MTGGILLSGDPHGATGISDTISLAEEMDADAVIFLGDCWDMSGPQCDYYEDKIPWSETTDLPVYFLLGNHEQREDVALARKQGVFLESNTTLHIHGITFGIISGIDAGSHMHLYWQQPALFRAIWDSGPWVRMNHDPDVVNKLEGSHVLLTHDAPRPMHLRNEIVGSSYLSEVLHHVKPQLAVHGHMHKYEHRKIYHTDVVGLDHTATDRPCLMLVGRDENGELHAVSLNRDGSEHEEIL